MKTAGLTTNDLKIMDMDSEELKDYRDRVLNEMLELQVVLDTLADDPGIVFPETSDIVEPYLKKWGRDTIGG